MLSSFVRESSAYNLQSRGNASVLENAERMAEKRKSIIEQQQANAKRVRELKAFTSASKNFLLSEAMFFR